MPAPVLFSGIPGLLELILNVGLSEVHAAFRLANDRLSEPRLVV